MPQEEKKKRMPQLAKPQKKWRTTVVPLFIAPVEHCRLPDKVPVKSIATLGEQPSSGSMRSSAGRRYNAGVSGWHTPAVQRDQYLYLKLYTYIVKGPLLHTEKRTFLHPSYTAVAG